MATFVFIDFYSTSFQYPFAPDTISTYFFFFYIYIYTTLVPFSEGVCGIVHC